MRQGSRGFSGFLATKAPFIVLLGLAIAAAGAWLQAQPVVFYILSVLTLFAAIALWAARGACDMIKSKEQLGFTRNRDWWWYEATGKGMPRGFYPLGGLCLVATLGLRSPYSLLAITCLMLTVSWGMSKRQWPNNSATVE